MRVIVMGDGNSIHLLNFVKVVLCNQVDIDITLFDINSRKKINQELYDFYKTKNINIVTDNGFQDIVKNNIIKQLPKVRTVVYLNKLSAKLRTIGKFDYCILHYVDSRKTLLALKNLKQLGRIIPVFWGSDLLRNKKIGRKYYQKLFKLSYKIIFNTENMIHQFKKVHGDIFISKSKVIKFPTLSFVKIDEIESIFSKDDLRLQLKLPLDKYIIICGHAGFRAERHQEMIEAISNCHKSILEKCYFIFPMTYGEIDLIEYQQQVINLMEKKGLNGEVLCNFLSNERMLKIINSSDMHITVIKTDAFSSVMQENLYSGSLLIYGKWLNYFELENNDIFARPINEISDITKELEFAVLNFNMLKPELVRNKKIISDISSPKTIEYMWNNTVFK